MSEARADVVEGVAGLTPAWLTTSLADATGGATIVAVELEPIGTGQMADTVRLRPTYEPAGAGPATLVAKVGSSSVVSRAAARATRTYEIEAGFYRDLVEDLPVRAPRRYHVGYDADTDDYVVLLEDVAPAQQGDQLTGCTVDEAAAAIDELALLHAPHWGDPGLGRLGWLDRATPENLAGMALLVQTLAPGFLERYGDRLDPEVAGVAERFSDLVAAYVAERDVPLTVAHGDYRVDNLLFGGPRVVVVDWQTVTRGPGIADLAYLLGASLTTELRRQHEQELLGHYRERLAAAGVELTADEVAAQYRLHAFSGLLMAMVASMIVDRTERGDEMFLAMADRHARHVLDAEAEALLR